MKKIFMALLASIIIATPVFAAEKNKVFVYEQDEKIYYDSKQFDDRFMVHENMVPGDSFSDELVVENGTSQEHDIYFKIAVDETNTENAKDLLDYIGMKLYINGELYYDGKAKGKDYRNQGVDLTDAVLIKRFAAHESVTMRVDTHFDDDYEDVENHDTAHVRWLFYLSDQPGRPDQPGKPDEITPNPRTNDDFLPWYFVIFGVSGAVLVAVIIYEVVHKKKDKKK